MATKQNFDTLFTLELEHIARSPNFAHKKPRLLLHACCGPCSSAVLERLADHFDITIFYYNPNIHPQTEYIRRLEELALFLNRRRAKQQKTEEADELFQTDIPDTAIELIRADYNIEDFFQPSISKSSLNGQANPSAASAALPVIGCACKKRLCTHLKTVSIILRQRFQSVRIKTAKKLTRSEPRLNRN